jgi:hypothetical protein
MVVFQEKGVILIKIQRNIVFDLVELSTIFFT